MGRNTISGSQLTALVACFVMGSALVLSSFPLGQDQWIAEILGLLEGLLIALIYITLAERFRGKSFVQISIAVYGPITGTIVAILFTSFLFQLGALVLRNFGDYFNTSGLPTTPLWMIIAALGIVCALAVNAGIRVTAKCSEVFLLPTTMLIILSVLALALKYQVGNFLPVANRPVLEILAAGHGAASFPFAEPVAFMMVFPFVSKHARLRGPTIKGIILGGAFVLLTTVRDIGVLGSGLEWLAYPSYTALRLISIGRIITRVEIIVGLDFITMGFIKVSVLLFGTVVSCVQIMHLRHARPQITAVTALMVFTSFIGFNSFAENTDFATKFWPFYAPVFQLALPLITLLIAIARGLPKEKER